MSWEFRKNIFGDKESMLWQFTLKLEKPSVYVNLTFRLGAFREIGVDGTPLHSLLSIGVTDQERCRIALGRDRMLYVFGNDAAGCVSPNTHIQLPELSYNALKKYIEGVITVFQANHTFGDDIAERYTNNGLVAYKYDYQRNVERHAAGEIVVNKGLPAGFARNAIGKYLGGKKGRKATRRKNRK